MDATGLAIGAVGLASLFQTVVQISDIIDTRKRYGVDSEILSIKLGIERVRLTMWGEKLGLMDVNLDTDTLQSRLDERLSDRRVSLAVSDVLSCMKRLFESSRGLTQRYGLQLVDDTAIVSIEQSVVPVAFGAGAGGNNSDSSSGGSPPRSNALKDTFQRTLDKFNTTITDNQEKASVKTSSKWAIVDKKRFELLVRDLRDFNDSLAALFPDVETNTQENMKSQIQSSNNAQSLRLIQEAAADDNHTLSDAASSRIDQIVQGDDKSDKMSSILLRPVDFDGLAKQIDRLQLQLIHKNRGMLNTKIIHSFGIKYSTFVHWEQVTSDGHFQELERETEYSKPQYLGWALQFTADKLDIYNDGNLSDYDPEAGRKFIGKIPATVTPEGYGAKFTSWAIANTPPEPELIVALYHEVPQFTPKDIVDRMQVLQNRKGLFGGYSNKMLWEETKRFVGEPYSGWPKPEDEYRMDMQIKQLREMLNRRDIFEEFSHSVCMGQYAAGMGGSNIFSVYLNIILAYELLIRVRRERTYSGITDRVMTAMALAERWMLGVAVVMPEGRTDTVQLHSLVHEQQVESLIRFAEVIDWPHIPEMRDFVEDAYVNIRRGGDIPLPLWSWIYGLVLPGHNFIFIIMFALQLATPSLKASMKLHICTDAGLVLEDRSYWRACTVLGGVLGGLKDIKSCCGWIGPCPVPQGVKPGWIRVKARSVAFRKPETEYVMEETDEGDETDTSRLRTPLSNGKSGAWIRSVGNPERWRTVNGVIKATERCELQAIRLQEVPPDPDSSHNEGQLCSEEYRVTLNFSIDGEFVAYRLYSNPCFITAPHCIDGPHSIHLKDLPHLENVVNVSDLKTQKHHDERVLIINATCEGGELVARAWCAENEQHAVIRRSSGACFTCSVKMASEQGLGVYCLIWA